VAKTKMRWPKIQWGRMTSMGGGKATLQPAAAAASKTSSRKRLLVVGINDESAIGAAEARSEIGSGTEIAIAGHGAGGENTETTASPDRPCIGTVAFYAERAHGIY
jgi:ribose transport system substrate-binding protein